MSFFYDHDYLIQQMADFPELPLSYNHFLSTTDGLSTDLIPQMYEPPEMPVAMSTPVRNSSAWNDLGSRSVPSRKRDSESASLFAPVGPSKSRRTTPITASDPFFHSSSLNGNGSHVDVIDLTGYVSSILDRNF